MDLKKKISFIGSGNMAEAIVKGVIFADVFDSRNVLCSDKNKEQLQYIKRKFKVQTTEDNLEALNHADVVVIAVKPQDINDLIKEMSQVDLKSKLLISVCAGIQIDKFEKAFKDHVRVVRVMPNTPALIGDGISVLCKGTYAVKKDMEMVKTIFKGVGEIMELKEEFFDAVTAVSGSGPAYVFYLLESMIDMGKKLKLKPEAAKKLAFYTFLGATRLAMDSKDDLKVLIKKVASKGGTTAEALEVFKNGKLRDVFMDGISAAAKRSKEISKSF